MRAFQCPGRFDPRSRGVIFFNIGGGLPIAIFLITTFLRIQPEEMFGAARIDGAKFFCASLSR